MDKRTIMTLAAFGILLLPALFIQIDALTFIEDEAIRAVVAQEMLISRNFIVPTISGEFYYNKPPLYNWIIALIFEWSGGEDEWMTRALTVVFLLLYAFGIFHYSNKHFSREQSILHALMFITCGRILFWDSMLGLIDVFFSGIVFWIFMRVYHCQQSKRWYSLFISVYILTVIGFLLKGLPVLVFTAATLLVAFILSKDFKRLFSAAHFTGIGIFFILIGAYYFAYSQHHDLMPIWERLFSESAKRTLWEYGVWDGVQHLLLFPFESSYHFLPWTLLAFYWLHPAAYQWVRQHQFIHYCFWVFVINILPYWTSPGIYPRYLHMLMPLWFILLMYLHERHAESKTPHYEWMRKGVLFLSAAIALGSFVPYFLGELLQRIPYLYVKVLFLNAAMVTVVYFMFKWQRQQWLLLCVLMLLIRLVFDMLVLPVRAESNDALLRQDTERIMEKYAHRPMHIYLKTDLKTHTVFYLNKYRKQITYRHTSSHRLYPEAVYLVGPNKEPDFRRELVVIDSFRVRHPVEYFYVAEMR